MTDTETHTAEIDAVVELPRTTLAPTLARRHIADLAPAEVIDDALLLVSELVTNAVRHGGPEITLYAARTGSSLRIEVHDSGDQLPVLPTDAHDPTATGGRGLLVVSILAPRWGVERSEPPPGKTVWVEFNLAGSPTANDQPSGALG